MVVDTNEEDIFLTPEENALLKNIITEIGIRFAEIPVLQYGHQLVGQYLHILNNSFYVTQQWNTHRKM